MLAAGNIFLPFIYTLTAFTLHKILRVIEDIGLRAMEHSPLLMSVLLASLKDEDSIVAGQSITSGQKLFCGALREMTLQVSPFA